MNPSFLVALLLANASLAQLLPPSTGVPTTTPTATSPSASQETNTSTLSTGSTTQPTTTTSPSDTSKTSSPTSSAQTITTAQSTQNTAVFTSTNANSAPATITVTSSDSSSAPSASSTAAPPNNDNSGGGLGVGPIIGMSVAGGIAVIGIVAFVIWKMTRKRFSEFDDNEAIKWPELNSHGNPDSHPLPVHTTGRAGFETGSEASLSRVNSSNYSTPDFAGGAGPDPYAVPPLPHLNPNQPYHDDPNGPAGYYDPYRGPVPGTLENGGNDWPGEAIPMTQMNASARTMSPAPSNNFVYDGGRQSPAPHLAYQGRVSPGPVAAYGGRGSPGPQAYGGASYGR